MYPSPVNTYNVKAVVAGSTDMMKSVTVKSSGSTLRSERAYVF